MKARHACAKRRRRRLQRFPALPPPGSHAVWLKVVAMIHYRVLSTPSPKAWSARAVEARSMAWGRRSGSFLVEGACIQQYNKVRTPRRCQGRDAGRHILPPRCGHGAAMQASSA